MHSRSVVIHIPHSATYIPGFLRQELMLDEEALRQNTLAFTDWRTRDLFTHAAFPGRVVFPVSRMVCDPERFRADEAESMAKIGLGAVYERDAFLRPLRHLDACGRELLLRLYYDPHHRRLTQAVTERLRQNGECLLVDAHSFSAVPLPYEPEQGAGHPDICVGTCGVHTPATLLRKAVRFFESRGLSVAVDYPYAGSMVPLRYLGDARVRSVMVEINRGLYRRAEALRPSSGYAWIKRVMGEFLKCLCA